MDHHFSTPDPVRLHVEVGRGSITVHATDDARTQAETRVRVEGPQADQVTVQQDGDSVRVTAPRRFGFGGAGEQELHVSVVLPTDSDAVLRTGSARTRVSGRLAALAVKSGSGAVQVDRLDGPALLATGSGGVKVDAVAGELQARSGSGRIVLGVVTAPTTVSTGSGDVDVHAVEAPIAIKTGSGDVEVAESSADVTVSTGSGDSRLRTVRRGRVTARGASGDVVLGIPAGTPVWTDINTLTGGIRSDLEPAGEPTDGQDHVEVRVKTATGDVVLLPTTTSGASHV